jgi:hypothetical protein
VARDAEQRLGRSRSRTTRGTRQSSGEPPEGETPKEPKEPRFSELRATLDYYRTGAPLLRYWWVVVIGAVVAFCVGLLALQAKREPMQYTSSAQMLVTSQEAPYFRYSVTREGTRSFGEDQPEQVVVDTGPPDTDTLVQAANLYPLLIKSDLVARERIERFGMTPGEIDARAVFAVQTPNRFDESSVPVIEVTGTATDPEDAVKIADQTMTSFIAWIRTQQQSAGVKEDQRILVEPISAARVVSQTGGPSYAIPILLAAAVFFAFCGLAFLLDSLSRRGRMLLAEHGDPAVPIPLSSTGTPDEGARSRGVEGSA